MDYLLSLVSKDQDTIVDAIKDLPENAEKVESQELEIKERNGYELDIVRTYKEYDTKKNQNHIVWLWSKSTTGPDFDENKLL